MAISNVHNATLNIDRKETPLQTMFQRLIHQSLNPSQYAFHHSRTESTLAPVHDYVNNHAFEKLIDF